jgi:ribosomal-protein-alanine N-acetyltransferase
VSDVRREAASVRLRPVRPGDEEAVLTLLSDERVVRYMLFPIFDRERARAFVARVSQPTSSSSAHPRQVVFGVETDADDGRLVGLCGLVIDSEVEQAEAWYLLRPDLWGRGLITEAVRRLVDVGFGELRLHRIWASCLPINPASARVLEKVGFRREGHLRQNLCIHGVWQDSYLYAVLESEWSAAR